YLARLDLPRGAAAVELGSGPGDVTRDLIETGGAATALGLEPSPVMVEAARARHADLPALRFEVGDAKATGLPDASQDLVAMHTLLIHCPGPEEALAEARRILKPGGALTVFDEEPISVTAATAEHDPMAPVIARLIEAYVHDRWLVRRLPALLSAAGFEASSREGHLYLPDPGSAYFRSIIDRGADVLLADGTIGEALAEGLRAEARRRADEGRGYGAISFVSLVARKA
ncbi:MAG: methyltransferase domain-containing protein, partial [Pseudomonadota bacterium]